MVRGGYAESSAGYGGDLEAEAQAWVEQVTGEPFEGDFADGLRDGVRLCVGMRVVGGRAAQAGRAPVAEVR